MKMRYLAPGTPRNYVGHFWFLKLLENRFVAVSAVLLRGLGYTWLLF